MAKGKGSKGTTYVSKGEIGYDRRASKELRREFVASGDRAIAQREAWKKGKRVMLLVPNSDGANTRERFVRVEAQTIWGDPRGRRGDKKAA